MPERAAEQEQHALPPRIGVAERDRAGAKDGGGEDNDPRIDRRSRAALGREQACINGKIGHAGLSWMSLKSRNTNTQFVGGGTPPGKV